ncbi:MAG: ATP-binding protein [Bradymonadaceae bacterium]
MRLSIATKIFIAFAGITIIFSSVLMFGIYRTQVLHGQIRTLNHRIVPLTLLLSDVQTDLKSFHVVLNERDPLLLRRTLQFTRLIYALPERFDERIVMATTMSADEVGLTSGDEDPLVGVHDRLRSLQDRAQKFAQRTVEFSDFVLNEKNYESAEAHAAIAAMQDDLRNEARVLDTEITGLRQDLRLITDQALARATDNERSSLYALGAWSGLALVVAIVLLILVLLTMRPLTQLAEAARRVGQGDYRPLSHLHGRSLGTDEVALLTREFNAMVQSLGERDVRLKTQHAALLKSERLATIGRMTSLITHELRNPLSSINLNTEMLMEALVEHGVSSEDPEMMPLLETIIGEVDRLRDITEEYLVYARLPTPKLERENICDIVQGLVDFHVWEWAQQAVDIELVLDEDAILIHADANQLRQAFLNLLKNATEASPEDSTVEVHVLRRGDHAVVEIKDSGAGIGQQALERLFEPFFTTKSNGTGLGLPMTQQIIEQHQGAIHVDSTLGSGTTFRVELPLIGSLSDASESSPPYDPALPEDSPRRDRS